jgi:hypothetical protein
MDLHTPYQESYPNLEKALRYGATIRISLSPERLRIVQVENKDNSLLSYGEDAYLSGALANAEFSFGVNRKAIKHQRLPGGISPQAHDVFDQYVYNHATDKLTIFYVGMWDKFRCMRPHPEPFMENQIIWGAGDDLLSTLCDCFINHHVEDKQFFMNRMSIQKKN